MNSFGASYLSRAAQPLSALRRSQAATTSRSAVSSGQPPLRRLALITDAWHPQTNGVVNTLVRLTATCESQGSNCWWWRPTGIAPRPCLPIPRFASPAIPGRPFPASRFAPDAIHVATEGPLGFWTVAWLRRHGLRFTTSFHTRYAEYLHARLPVPLDWGYQVVRWFHERADHTLVSSRALLEELQGRRVGQRLVHWPRGVDAAVFHPTHRCADTYADLPRPIWLYVGRIAVEKTLDDFLGLPLAGTKVVVGDGPSRADLQRRFPGRGVARLPVR